MGAGQAVSERTEPLRVQIAASVLCFLVILADGYDTAVISYAAPTLAHVWNVPPAAFTPAFVATSLGAVIGYLCCGALSSLFGHRRVIIVSVIAFGLLCLLTLFATGISQLTAARFVTALGLGGAVPTAIALASDHAPARRRELTAVAVTVAIVFGISLGGLVAVPLLRQFGWRGPFVLGGVAPLLLALALLAWLPDTAGRARRREERSAPGGLLRDGLAIPTLLLWAMTFLSFMQSYSFTYWLPLLLTSFGFDRATAALGNSYTGFGAIAGVLLMLVCVPFVGSARYLAASFVIGSAFVLVLSFGGLPNSTVPALLFLIGAGLGIGGVGQATIGAMLYPAALRTTGIGWSSAMGRIGSIVGPAFAGAFVGLEWPARSIIALATVPALISAAAAVGIFLTGSRRRAAAEAELHG